MDEREYLDPAKWPRTTQRGLSLTDQQMLDAFHRDTLQQKLDHGEPLTETQRAAMAELKRKTAHFGR